MSLSLVRLDRGTTVMRRMASVTRMELLFNMVELCGVRVLFGVFSETNFEISGGLSTLLSSIMMKLHIFSLK